MLKHRSSTASATAVVMTARRATGRALAGPQTCTTKVPGGPERWWLPQKQCSK